MEGGFTDVRGRPLKTLQAFLQGQADFVSTAMDKDLHLACGTKLHIPELDRKLRKSIEFRVVDTGGALTNKGFRRIDICVANEAASLDELRGTTERQRSPNNVLLGEPVFVL